MGNSKSTTLKELYGKQRCEVVQSESDKSIGAFKIIRFQGFRDELFILKILDPNIYDEYSDIPEFTKRLSQTCPAICEFYFIQVNAQNNELYDLLYEFGALLSECFTKEKHAWRFINQTLQGLLFMENTGLHYPLVSKRYIVRTDKKTTKLINPYCFPDFIKEVLQIYLNPQNPVSNRKNYAMGQIANNIKDFGILLCTAVANVSEYELRTDPMCVVQLLESLSRQFSPNYLNLIRFILLNPRPPRSFLEIRDYIQRIGSGVLGNPKMRSDLSGRDSQIQQPLNAPQNLPKGQPSIDSFGMPDKQSLGSMSKPNTLSTQDRDSMPNTSSVSQKSLPQSSTNPKPKVRIFEDFPAERSTPLRTKNASPAKLQNVVIAQPNPNLKESVSIQNNQAHPNSQATFAPNSLQPNEYPAQTLGNQMQPEVLPLISPQFQRPAHSISNPQQAVIETPNLFSFDQTDSTFFTNMAYQAPSQPIQPNLQNQSNQPNQFNQPNLNPDPTTPIIKNSQSAQDVRAYQEVPPQVIKQSTQLELTPLQPDLNQLSRANFVSPTPIDLPKLSEFQTPDIKEFASIQNSVLSMKVLATPDITGPIMDKQINRNSFSQRKIENPLNFNLRGTSFSNAKNEKPIFEANQAQEQRFAHKSISSPVPYTEMAQQTNFQNPTIPPAPYSQNPMPIQQNMGQTMPVMPQTVSQPPLLSTQSQVNSFQSGLAPQQNSEQLNPNVTFVPPPLFQPDQSQQLEYSLFDNNTAFQGFSTAPNLNISQQANDRLFNTAPLEFETESKQNPELTELATPNEYFFMESAPQTEYQQLPVQKRESLISDDAIVPPVMPEFAFINNQPHKGISMNSYLQLHDRTSTQPLDVSPYFSDEKHMTKDFIEDGSKGAGSDQPNRPISDFNFHEATHTEDLHGEEIQEANQNYGLSAPTQDSVEQPKPQSSKEIAAPFSETKPLDQPPVPPNNKKIKRLIHRWISGENRHQKIIEYEDGTTEEVPSAEDDEFTKNILNSSQISNSQIKPQASPNAPINNPLSQPTGSIPPPNEVQPIGQGVHPTPFEKASHINFYNIPESKPIRNSMRDLDANLNNLHFILIPDNGMPAILLFKPKALVMNSRFHELGQIVDKVNAACPSMYHQIEDSFVKPVPPNAFANTSDAPQKSIRRQEEPVMMQPVPVQPQIVPIVNQNPVLFPISISGGPVASPFQMMPQVPVNRTPTSTTLLSNNPRIIRRV